MFNKTIKPTLAASLVALTFSATAADERYIIQVDNNSKGIVKALARQAGGEIKVDADGFVAATFSGKSLEQVKGLLNNPNIKLIEADERRFASALYSDDAGDPMTSQVTPYAVYQSQADQVTFDSNAGMKVCVIDSGLDSSNPDFNWSAITGDNDPGTGNWFENGGPHGTHVAGTIGAADNGIGVVGMAPGVDMHVIKVFNAEGWGYSSDLARAAQLCQQAGANIINMSLGGGGANSTEENAFINFKNAGGLAVAAAGNDGNSVRSYPAGYPAVMMIGANDADNNIADFSQYPSCTTGRGKRVTEDETICVEATAGGVDTLSTYPAGMATTSALSADGAFLASSSMENSGDASGQTYFMGIADTTDNNASGKVCLIDRGSISFYDKVKNCELSGGIGAVIINNEPGMLYATLGDTNDTSIPAVGVAQEDRQTMLDAATVDIRVGTSDYGLMSGTSMATPAVAGLAALVWSNYPACSGEDVRAAFKATALDAGANGKDVYFGYGIVQAKAAADYLAQQSCAGGDGGDTGGEPSGELQLTASGYKVKGTQAVDLNWLNASGSQVDIYRNGNLAVTTANDGAYTDSLNVKGGGSYQYQVCEAGTSVCTASVSVVF
ncbi:S8 family serine peptidase [Salinimonas lutimaris]|uniref:S8 family serine peptidase n=1 Tax=Salinimonas lutimaris TaxID=914153 RepID=UPI0010C0F9A9|nr:S8 family serine peptidase [Salinimonas lutimaris]